MRTIISLVVAIFIHFGLFYFLLPKKEIIDAAKMTGKTPQTKFQSINLTQFRVQKKVIRTIPVGNSPLGIPAKNTVQLSPGGMPGNYSLIDNVNTSTEASFIHFETPEYPGLARIKGLEGKVKIKVIFNDQGAVSNVEIIESSSHQLLDNAVKNTARKWVAAAKQNRVFEKTFEFKLKN